MTDLILDRVAYALDDGIARIELARPAQGNAVDLRMGEALSEATRRVGQAAQQGEARVAVISAQGKYFCVGGDLSDFSAAPDRAAHIHRTASVLHEGIRGLHELAIPTVSVVHGTVAGAGLGIALAADIALIADEARGTAAYTKAGLTPDSGLSWVLARRLPWALASDLVFTNRMFTGAEATAWGLFSRSVPAGELAGIAEDLVRSLREGATQAFVAAKRLMTDARGRDLREHLEVETETVSAASVSEHGYEGIAAFLEKRPPHFS